MKSRIPSAGTLIAVIALVFALAGGAYAANELTKKQVTKIAKKQANKQINKRESGLNVNSAKTATNAVNALNAGNVGGLAGHKLNTKVASQGAPATVLDVKGLKLTLECPGGLSQLQATTTVNNSVIASVGGSGDTDDTDFDTGETEQIASGAATFTFTTPTGDVVSGTYFAGGTATGCVVAGTAFSG